MFLAAFLCFAAVAILALCLLLAVAFFGKATTPE
jgi:hypothetical protein